MVAVVSVVLCAASPASGANVVPNPGFETDCGGIPCNWTGPASVTATRDTSAAHSGAASLLVTRDDLAPNDGFEDACGVGLPCNWTAASGAGATVARETSVAHSGAASMKVTTPTNQVGAFSDCVPVLAGNFDAAFWYTTTDTNATNVRLSVTWFSSNNCGTSLSSNNIASGAPVLDLDWHQVTGAMTAPAGTHSALLFLTISCTTCGGGVAVNFDDVDLYERNTARGAFADCIPASQGSFDAAFWYRGADPNADAAHLTVTWFSSNNCSSGGLGPSSIFSNSLVLDSNWHQVTGTITAPAGTQSGLITLTVLCVTCIGGAPLGFDDVQLDQTPTAVVLSSFSARRTTAGVAVRWRTSSEAAILGFNVYRQRHGTVVKLNRALIPVRLGEGARGHSYSWLDRSGPGGAAAYRLQAVAPNGTRTWIGTAFTAA